MKVGCTIAVLFISTGYIYGQRDFDPLNKTVVQRTGGSSGIDSTLGTFIQVSDSLTSFHKIDSVRQQFNLAADNVRKHYQAALTQVDATTRKLNGAVDSLRLLNMPTIKYEGQLDSLTAVRREIQTKFTSRLNDLKSNTVEKLNALDLPQEYQKPINDLTKNIDRLNLNTDAIRLPEINIPGYSPLKIDGVGDLPSAGEINGISNTVIVTDQAHTYADDIKSITEGNVSDVGQFPEALEQQASRIEGMDELQKQSGLIDDRKVHLEEFKDSEKGKRKAVELAKNAAVDHFAGKEEQLKAAMKKISKYKQKHSSVSSIKDLPKRPPNPLKEKPFIERLTPGLYLQYQQKNDYHLDVNPYVGYKITGRFTTGLGWNHRFSYDEKHRSLNSRSRIFGPRAYLDFKLGKGFIGHLEAESMNTFVPSTLVGNPDTGQREWVWSFMTGIKKEYKIYKNLKGTVLMQYNWFNKYYKAPYVDRLNSRIGFEYVLKKGRRKTS